MDYRLKACGLKERVELDASIRPHEREQWGYVTVAAALTLSLGSDDISRATNGHDQAAAIVQEFVSSPQEGKPGGWPTNRLDDKRTDAGIKGSSDSFELIEDHPSPLPKAVVFGWETMLHLRDFKGPHLPAASLERKGVPQASRTNLQNRATG